MQPVGEPVSVVLGHLQCQWQVVSGRWPVLGGKWQVASGRWPVVGGRWQCQVEVIVTTTTKSNTKSGFTKEMLRKVS